MFESILSFLENQEGTQMMNETQTNQNQNLEKGGTLDNMIVTVVASGISVAVVKGVRFGLHKIGEKISDSKAYKDGLDSFKTSLDTKAKEVHQKAEEAKQSYDEEIRAHEEKREKERIKKENEKLKKKMEKENKITPFPTEKVSQEEEQETETPEEKTNEESFEENSEPIEFSDEDETILYYVSQDGEDIEGMSDEEKLEALEKAKKFQHLISQVGVNAILDKMTYQVQGLAKQEYAKYCLANKLDFSSREEPKYMCTSKRVLISTLNDVYKILGSSVELNYDEFKISELLKGKPKAVHEFTDEAKHVLIYPVLVNKYSFAVVTLNQMTGCINYALYVYDGNKSYEFVDEYSFDIC